MLLLLLLHFVYLNVENNLDDFDSFEALSSI